MNAREAGLAAEVLRAHAPAKSHEVRRACFTAAEYLDGHVRCQATIFAPRPFPDLDGRRDEVTCELDSGHAGSHESRLPAGGTLTWLGGL